MRVLVTGGTGFLGSWLVKRLVNDTHDVLFVGRNAKKGEELQSIGAKFIKEDLINFENIEKYFKDIDVVFHCAAKSSPWGKYKDFYNSNVVATKNVIKACKDNNVKRLVHVSTPSIYFDFQNRFDLKEDFLPVKRVNHYAETKYLAEREIDNAYKEGQNVITIRPRGIFGIGDTSILPRLIRANNKMFIPVISENVIVDVCYVENVVEALILCMDSDKSTLGKKYNITNCERVELNSFIKDIVEKLGYKYSFKKINYTLAYFMANIFEVMGKIIFFGKEPPFTKYTLGILSKSQTLDISKAKKELGYVPKFSIEYGVNMLVKGYKDEG